MKLAPKQLQIVAWSLSGLVTVLAFTAWWQGYGHALNSVYQLFPLFGLLAFSLMWSHYIASALRQHAKIDGKALHTYFEVTSMIVLVAILLHPGLLMWQLWRDGMGLPPFSTFDYVAPALKGAIILGEISWVTFIAYEFRKEFGKKNWWKYVQYASDLAMFLIFIHALKLGGQLQTGWFRNVWYVYGVTLIIAITYSYCLKLGKSKD